MLGIIVNDLQNGNGARMPGDDTVVIGDDKYIGVCGVVITPSVYAPVPLEVLVFGIKDQCSVPVVNGYLGPFYQLYLR